MHIKKIEEIDKEKHSAFWRNKQQVSSLLQKTGILPSDSISGQIIAAAGKNYLVLPENFINEFDDIIECGIAGKVISPHQTSTIAAVGDSVYFIENKKDKTQKSTGTIIAIDERRTFLSRTAPGKVPKEQVIASNLDKVLVFMSVMQPDYNCRLLDRFLIAAEQGSITSGIAINKIDLIDLDLIRDDFQVYLDLGIRVFFVSAIIGDGINELMEFFSDSTTLLIGPSGSGKSTLINTILGKDAQKVRSISLKTDKGRHTTSFVKMFSLTDGSRTIDSPGIREFGLFGIPKEEIALYFHEFDEYFPRCRYVSCTHSHEPDCAVKSAVEAGQISFARYESYLNILDTL